MKKILALILTLVAVFSLATACTPDSDLSTGGGSSGGQESGITGGSSGGGSSDSGSGDSSGDSSIVVPPITDGGNFDGGDY